MGRQPYEITICPGCGKKLKMSSMELRHTIRKEIGAHENNMTIHFMHKLMEKILKLREGYIVGER